MTVPILTSRLVLRAFTHDDAPQLHSVLYRDPEAMHFIGGPHSVQATRQGIERYVDQQEADGFSFWAVEERETGLMVGEAGLFPLNGRGPDVEVGYAFGSPWWGRGFATEAATAILGEAFGPLDLHRVVAVAKRENTGSLNVLRKIGFREEGDIHAWGSRQAFFV
nr:GNAT family N-acetyltransferase [Solirubrobacterales bacterium]